MSQQEKWYNLYICLTLRTMVDRWEGSKNTTRKIYKRCIFLRVESKQHVSDIYGHHQVLGQLRFHYINCVMMWRSIHRIIVEIYLCIGRYYARLLCSGGGTRVSSWGVLCRHGVSNWMSSSLSSRLLLWGCLWMTLVGTVLPVGEHKVWDLCIGNSGDVWGCMRMVLYVPPQVRPFPLRSSIDSLTTTTS